MASKPLLRDQPTRKWTAQDQDDLANHLKHRKPGEENPLDEPLKFGKRAPQTLNPTEDNLIPEEMIGRTFSMPPTADGSRHRAKIMESVRDMKDKHTKILRTSSSNAWSTTTLKKWWHTMTLSTS